MEVPLSKRLWIRFHLNRIGVIVDGHLLVVWSDTRPMNSTKNTLFIKDHHLMIAAQGLLTLPCLKISNFQVGVLLGP